MAATRGARYLLRNGLDYINYQEYERALRYLREAEVRQKELNDSEKLALKQAIERAQRGLREAVGSEAPYALSRRSHRTGGFAPARPETAIAADSPAAARSRPTPAPARTPSREGDDQGQPIRLAGVEVLAQSGAAVATAAAANPDSRPAPAELPKPLSVASDQPAQLPELSKLPQITEKPDLAGAGAEANPALVTPEAQPGPASTDLRTPARAAESLPAKEPAKSPEPGPQPTPGAPTQAAAPMTSEPKLDAAAAAAAAQHDLLSPLPPLTPAEEVQAKDSKPALADTADLKLEAQPVPASDPAARSAPAPIAAPGAGPELAKTAENTPATIDAKAVPASSTPASPASEPAGGPPGASPAPINLEPPSDPAAKPVTATPPPSAREPESVPLPPLGTEAEAPRPSAPTPRDTAPVQTPAAAEPPAAVQPLATGHDEPSSSPPHTAQETGQNRDGANASVSTESAAPAVAVVPDDLPPLPPQGTAARQTDSKIMADALPPAAEDLPPLPQPDASPAPAAPEQTGTKPASEVAAPAPASVPSPGPAPAEAPTAEPVPAAEPVPTLPADPRPTAPAAASSPTPAETLQQVGAPEATPSGTDSAPAPGSAPAEAAALLPVSGDSDLAPVPPAGGTRPIQVDPRLAEPRSSAVVPAAARMTPAVSADTESFIPLRENPPTTLHPELQREVEEIARKQEEDLRRSQERPAPTQPPGAGDTGMSTPTQTQTQVDISRAPSPAEARPIRAIPVPDDWVPLPRREWSPQRKYWAAAATCHLPLYFQDTMLERYGHSVETYFGPAGRCLTYPVDKPTESTQRNQIAQPFFSAGLFAWHIITWPYALVVDPPWEAQYDLGYWRPGDRIPTDLYYQPLHGTGPPLRGRQY